MLDTESDNSVVVALVPTSPSLHLPPPTSPLSLLLSFSPPLQVGNHIDVQSQKWVAQDAGIGAGVDSYFEYLVKGAIMLQDEELLNMFLGNCCRLTVSLSCHSPVTWQSCLNDLCDLARVRPGHPELHPFRRLVPVGSDA